MLSLVSFRLRCPRRRQNRAFCIAALRLLQSSSVQLQTAAIHEKSNSLTTRFTLSKAWPRKDLPGETHLKAWTKKPFPRAKLEYGWGKSITPTASQLEYADRFFLRSRPEFLWSTSTFREMKFAEAPEVCVLGRSNVGKSSMLNALLGARISYSSSKPGRTQLMNAFGVGSTAHDRKPRLVVLDMPGYGHGGRTSHGEEIMKYLEKRKQLMRAFLLVDSEHGIKSSDLQILALFRQANIPYQIIFSKVDKILLPSRTRMPSEGALHKRLLGLRNRMQTARNVVADKADITTPGKIIGASSTVLVNGYLLGMDLVRHSMLEASSLALEAPVTKPIETSEIVPWDQINLPTV